MRQGDSLSTPFGQGKVVLFREKDAIYVIQLPFATLYANRDSITIPSSSSHSISNNSNSSQDAKAMELNVAYEALDAMRKLNLEIECQERGIPFAEAQHQCTICLLSSSFQSCSKFTRPTTRVGRKRFPRIQKLVHEHVSPKLGNIKLAASSSSSCLSCGSPVCSTHSSPQFKQQGIVVCRSCQHLFSLDFVVECMTAPNDDVRRDRIRQMVDVYDRLLLLLQYSSQFMTQVSSSLRQTTVVQNKVGIGSSSAGIVSGVLGVAAAATILTPAGPPLLIASLLFGGSATAVQTGTDVKNYYSEANRLADRILALHGMVKSILKVTSTLRDALLRDYLRTDGVELDKHLLSSQEAMYEKYKGTVLAGLTVGRAGAAGMELGALATVAEVGAVTSRTGRLISRSSTGILRTARFARIAGVALSAATLLFETKCMTDTIQSIRAGNPCEKAELLETIDKELPSFPTTSNLDRELQRYLEGLAQRKRRMTEEECVRLILDASQLHDYSTQEDEEDDAIVFCCETNDSGDTASTVPSSYASLHVDDDPSVSSTSSTTTSNSLLERIERFKRKEESDYGGAGFSSAASPAVATSSSSAPLIERISMYKNTRSRRNDSEMATMATTNDKNVPVATLG